MKKRKKSKGSSKSKEKDSAMDEKANSETKHKDADLQLIEKQTSTGDSTSETVQSEASQNPSHETVAAEMAIEEQLEAAKAERDQFKDRYMRIMAEFDNYKRRTQMEFSNVIRSANEDLILELLEVVDNFERALGTEGKEGDLNSYKKGVELIYEKLMAVLKNKGTEPFETVGNEFDPELHDAMMQMPCNDVPENHVVQEILKGYRLRDKVIRHARVIVSKGKAETKGKQDEDSKTQAEQTAQDNEAQEEGAENQSQE